MDKHDTASGLGSSTQSDWSRPQYNVDASQIGQQVQSLGDFVIIGKSQQGEPFVASTRSEEETGQMIKQYGSNFLQQGDLVT